MMVGFYTLGCRLNQCESEACAQEFAKAGFTVADKECEIYIVNTCTVTSKAEQKARRMIRKYASEAQCLAVVVTGCYAQVNRPEIEALDEKVCVLSGSAKSKLLRIPEILKSVDENNICGFLKDYCSSSDEGDAFAFNPDGFIFHTRAYLKVQDGCDNSCGYCRVHIARGKSVSLDRDEVVRRALKLERAGYREIVLTGCNLTMYDHDGDGIGGLLNALLNNLGAGTRLRFSSLEPDHIDPLFLSLIKDRRVQPHFHIPIQSGSDKVLSRVGRHYSVAELENVIKELRDRRPEAFFACDVITGLPGEDEREFEKTYDFIKRNNFSQLHVFPFSPRPDTELYKATDRVAEDERDRRAEVLRKLSEELHCAYVRNLSKKETEVLLERKRGCFWEALSAEYIKTRLPDRKGLERGMIVKAVFATELDGSEDPVPVTEA